MKEKEILQEIIEWLHNDTSYLSTRSIINGHAPDLLANN